MIFLPIFLPLLDDFGVDPIFFGVLVALNLQTSFLSPPVAMAPFYLKGVAPKHVTIDEIFKASCLSSGSWWWRWWRSTCSPASPSGCRSTCTGKAGLASGGVGQSAAV